MEALLQEKREKKKNVFTGFLLTKKSKCFMRSEKQQFSLTLQDEGNLNISISTLSSLN